MTTSIRQLSMKDAPFMLEWMTDPDITRFFRFDESRVTLESCIEYIESSSNRKDAVHFAIVDENDEYLGTISLKNLDLGRRCAEYAISTRKKAHGTGAAMQATRLILQYAFETLGLKRVYLNVLAENGRANAFYRKAGFRFAREEPEALELRGEMKTLNWYEIEKEEVLSWKDHNNKEQTVTEKKAGEYPLVSCIVTCFQKVPYLFEAIDSVMTQDYPNLELIVTDDGTVDFNKGQIEDFIADAKRENLVDYCVIHHDENIGTVRNIRSALKRAKGEFCVNLDGDDVFHHNTVVSEIINEMIKRNLDVLECSKIRCDGELNDIEMLPTPCEKERIIGLNTAKKQFHSFAVFQFLNIGGGSGLAYRREEVERIGLFDERYRNWQDGPSLVAYVKSKGMIPVNYDIVAIKYRGGGVSNSPAKNRDAFSHISDDRKKFIENVTIPDCWNPHVFSRRKILFRYYWDSSKTNRERIKTFLRFPEQGVKMRINKYHKLILMQKKKKDGSV